MRNIRVYIYDWEKESMTPEKPDILCAEKLLSDIHHFGQTGGESRGTVTKEELRVQIAFQDADRRPHH